MSFVELKPDLYSEYNGIHVGLRHISYTKFVASIFSEKEWKYVKIEYDLKANKIRFSKAERMKGHTITKSRTITSQVGRHMPNGRYMCEVQGDVLLFTKY